MAVTPEQIAPQLEQLLPRGAAWRGPPTRVLYRLLLATADELARLYQRATDLRSEAHPPGIDELLDDWERELGLPAACLLDDQTDDERRAAIEAHLLAQGGQSRAYFIGVAAALGIEISIEEPRPFEVGIDGCGDALGEIDWRFAWIVHARFMGAPTYLDAGSARAGERLAQYGSSPVLECTLARYKPAHTVLVMDYAES